MTEHDTVGKALPKKKTNKGGLMFIMPDIEKRLYV